MLPTFSQYYTTIKTVEKCLENNDGTIEGFFEELERNKLSVEDVMTGDIAGMTLPLGMMKRREPIMEKAPPSKKAERFITKSKTSFKKRYGDNWEQVLYATAWKLFGNDKDEEEDENGNG